MERYFTIDDHGGFTGVDGPGGLAARTERGRGAITVCTCSKGTGRCRETSSMRCNDDTGSIRECLHSLYDACRG